MATTEHFYTGNNSTTDYSFTFPYLKTADIKVTLDAVATTAYTLPNSTTVRFNTAPGTGVDIHIYRETDVDTAKAVFAAGSSIRAADLNNNEDQALYSLQEAQGQVFKTTNLKDGAVTYAKIQNVSTTDRVLGRDSSGAGDIEEIAPSALRTMINVEDGATADQTNAEIRAAVEAATDSNVFTDADHTKLNGIATSANNYSISSDLLDEDNFASDSATKPPSQQSTKAYIAATSQPLDSDLTTLAGMQSGTASILASSTALTSTTTEINQLDGKTVGETSLTTNSNTAIPTSKAVADHVTGAITALGGFKAIAGPTNFASTQPEQGVVVSVADVGSGFTVSSQEITITNGAGTGNNVRITGFPTSLNGTIADDVGIQVLSLIHI